MSTEAGPPGSVAPGVPLGSHYLVFELVGTGATGAVYRGSERDGGPDLAVKILRPELASDPEVVTRFVRERSILLSVVHPNLVTVHDLVMEGSTLAIVMDFVRGGDLRSYLRQSGPLSPNAAAQLVAQILNALGAVHARGIVHRDLKPENVLVDMTNPAAPAARLTDFGIARIAHGPSFTRLSGLLGTPEYMAPEQADRDECGPAADLYAAGILFYELVCGTTPFAGGHPVAVIRAHIDEAPRRPTGMSDALWAVVERLLAKSPEDRPATAALAAVELRAAAISATRPLPPQPEPPPRPEPQTVSREPDAGDRPTHVRVVSSPTPPHSEVVDEPRPRKRPGEGRAEPPRPAPPRPEPQELPTHLRLGRPQTPAVTPEPEPAPRSRRLPAMLALGIAAVVVAAAALVGFVVLRGGGASGGPATYTFAPAAYPNQLIVGRTWTLTSGGRQFHGDLAFTNGGAGALTATVVEVLPKSLAPSTDSLSFQPSPDLILQRDPVVQYVVQNLPPGATIHVGYSRAVPAGQTSSSRLRAWAADQVAAQAASQSRSSQSSPSPATLASLAFGPGSGQVTAGKTTVLALQGTMSDGSVAPPAVLASVAWASSDPSVALITTGTVTALHPGTTTVSAQAGVAKATRQVVVTEAVPSGGGPSQAPPTLPATRPPTTAPAPAPTTPAAPSPSPTPGIPVYRLYAVATNDHFYTANSGDRDLLVQAKTYTYEGIGFYACDTGTSGALPVYRLYYPAPPAVATGTHFYTQSLDEKNAAIKGGFKDEGVAFSACAPGSPGAVPVYRLQKGSAYFYTPSPGERSAAIADGFHDVGIAFYARTTP